MVASVLLGLALFASFILFFNVWNRQAFHFTFDWLNIKTVSGNITIRLGLLFDNVTVFMCLVVLIISLAVHIFSIDYMKGEFHYRRFFALLGFFTFSMLGFILADNLLMLFIFWELIGFSSYVLIGFWFRKPSAARAARKTFIVNRIADIGFMIALMILWSRFGTFDLIAIKKDVAGVIAHPMVVTHGLTWLFFAGFGLFIAAAGKSAQFPLLVWLPEAMEGPIPVSALIHAATMVTAGVFLLVRTYAVLTLPVLTIIAVTGTISAFMGAVAALSQYDLKKVLAYSTISQLGFMIMGVGVGAKEAALFHLFTHAFFKAGLFLAAGLIIKSLSILKYRASAYNIDFDVQDMRLMGGLKNKLPVVFITFSVFSAALAGIPFFSGFLSKDTILNGSVAWAQFIAGKGITLAYLVPFFGFLTSLLTVLYIGRAVALTFFGEFRLQKLYSQVPSISEGLKPRPTIAKIPVIMLAILSLAIIFSINPFSPGYSWVMAHIKPGIPVFNSTPSLDFSFTLTTISGHYNILTSFLSVIVSVAGIFAGIYLYMVRKNSLPRVNRITVSPDFFQALSYNNWYLDRFYRFVLVRPFNSIAVASSWVDRKIFDKIIDNLGILSVLIAHITGWLDRILIDGLVKLTAWIIRFAGKMARAVQSGKIQAYYIWAITILILIVLWWSL